MLSPDAPSATMLQVLVSFGTASKNNASAVWSVRRVNVNDSIGEPYRIEVQLGTKGRAIKPSEMRGQNAWVAFARGRTQQILHGIVVEVRPGGFDGVLHVLDLVIVPALSLLEHRTTSRIFADQSVPEIAKSVLEQGLAAFGRKVALNLDTTKYEKREYVVQHQESDLAFVLRLLADEGIWLDVRQASEAEEPEEVWLTNANAQAAPIAPDAKLIARLDREALAHEEAVTEFGATEATLPTQFAARQFNWTHPEVFEKARQEVEDPASLALPVYEYGGVQAIDHPAKQYKNYDTEQKLKFRREAARVLQTEYGGESNVVLLCAGRTFAIGEQTYLLTHVSHQAQAVNNTGGSADNATYLNVFSCIPVETPYRPPPRKGPRVAGVEHATVVDASGGTTAPASGETGADIVVDANQHGRVRVKFHWDDTAPGKGGTTSCWLRSVQMWSGAGWGTQFLPRVGMEVIVAFEGGDPDRPVILGCLYNGLNPPPYADKPTQSGIKTQSSVHRGHYNELRFDDAASNEQIYVRAQKDYVEHVLNNHTTTVDAHQNQTVKKTQTETVLGTQTLTVIGKRTKTVGGDDENGEQNVILGTRDTRVTKKVTDTFEDEYSQTVTAAVNITHDATRTTTVKNDDIETITKGSKATAVLEGTYEVRSAKAITIVQDVKHGLYLDGKAHLQTAGDFTITNGKSTVVSEGGGLKLTADDTITIGTGQAAITLKKDGSINVTGTKIAFTVGNNSIVTDATGVTTSGVKVSSTAVGLHEIQGALIKIG